jgi:DNA (cytosine-5)-methyltransferase 1
MTKPTFGSLFAGVGGFDLGFESAGYECRFQVEWDKNCQQTLAHHWPDVPRWGDVSDVNGADLPPVDVVTYGFPCQDLSIAGARAGLDGDRSNLFFQAVRIIKEMREATNGRYPTWAVAENVPGLLNADAGSAMARVLDALAEAGAMVIEWCVLDAQWFGVPQRRRRVFVAACFNSGVADRCPDPLFPVAKSGARNPSPCNQAEQDVAGPASDSVGTGFRMLGFGHYVSDVKASNIQSPDHKYATDLVAFVKARRAQNPDDYETWIADAPNPTLNEFDGGDKRTTTAIVQPTFSFDTQFGSNANVFDNLSPTLKSTQTSPSIANNLAVRRLTPLECERLMGWPDNHTLHRADGKTNTDSTRYKQCGNGVAAPVAKWIAEKLEDTL